MQNKLVYLIERLLQERGEAVTLPQDLDGLFHLYRGLVNLRPPKAADDEYLRTEDELLQQLTAKKGITDMDSLKPQERGIYLWQGDITTLRCDAIVNAANSALLGCFQPCHSCIDNCIHTYAGVRLRLACQEIMGGGSEPAGRARVTAAYNLPCRYVIHTVGPIVSGGLTREHCRELESCYLSCLEAAREKGLKSITFCCISTGVFGFPQGEAARIAVDTVRKNRGGMEVIFNVFTDTDYEIYRQLLG